MSEVINDSCKDVKTVYLNPYGSNLNLLAAALGDGLSFFTNQFITAQVVE